MTCLLMAGLASLVCKARVCARAARLGGAGASVCGCTLQSCVAPPQVLPGARGGRTTVRFIVGTRACAENINLRDGEHAMQTSLVVNT